MRHGTEKRPHCFAAKKHRCPLMMKLSLGAEITAPNIRKAAQHQAKLPAGVETRLDDAKGYLFGSVEVQKFDPLKFEEAAKLLEELSF